ncbi:hypothetical protein ABZ642_45305, partial [Streptomyces sp. NPDC007157]
EFACVGDVRGRGLMIGVELVDPEGEQGPGAQVSVQGVSDDHPGGRCARFTNIAPTLGSGRTF